LAEKPLMVIDSENSEVTTDVFKTEFDQLDAQTRETVLGLFDPVRDHLKYELLENINEVKETIDKSQEGDVTNDALAEVGQKMVELGEGIKNEVAEQEQQEEPYLIAQRIFAANSMQVCEVGALYSATEGALYHHISFLNHSCNPNSVWSWTIDDFRKKVVRAVKDIKKGEEILCNYVDLEEFNYGSREIRRAALADKFGFFCKCSECSLEGDELDVNEQQRSQIVANLALIKELMKKFEEKSTVGALKTGTDTVGMVSQLGLALELPRLMLNIYQVASAARYQNIIGTINPTTFSQRALQYCQKFGDSFMYFYNFVCKPD